MEDAASLFRCEAPAPDLTFHCHEVEQDTIFGLNSPLRMIHKHMYLVTQL